MYAYTPQALSLHILAIKPLLAPSPTPQGHAAPVLYAAWAEAGVIPIDELKNLRKVDSELEGHPTPVS